MIVSTTNATHYNGHAAAHALGVSWEEVREMVRSEELRGHLDGNGSLVRVDARDVMRRVAEMDLRKERA